VAVVHRPMAVTQARDWSNLCGATTPTGARTVRRRRFAEKFDTWDVLRKYNPDWRLIFVGDATMSPYEILQPGGSVEHNNVEAGAVWLQRFAAHFPKHAWINPEPEGLWQYRQSISLVNQIIGGRMFPLSLEGLTRAMRLLSK